MPTERPFQIISVTGAHSGVGKTTLCSLLLENLKDLGAIKFTKTSLYTSVTDDEETLAEEEKDTAVFLRSGAAKVVWIQSPGGPELEDALNISLTKMTGLPGVVVEGNSPLSFLDPSVVIFVMKENGQIKPSASFALERADIIIVNSDSTGRDAVLPDRALRENVKIFRIDLSSKTGEIDKFLTYVRQYTE
ncbi:MAG: hypothetical protein C4538_08910 [Nitrospiraceae bacterium]|nr:MAG: hypothetical protein C4538_08910 [Nitrospiraceae bacterium]